MNLITVVKQGGQVAATIILVSVMALMPSQTRAQVAFSLFGNYAHNNRPYQISTGFFDGSANLQGIEMVNELYDSGYRFDHSGDFYYVNRGGAGFNGVQGVRGIATADFDHNGTDDSVYINQNSITIRYHNLDRNVGYYAEGAAMVTVADVDGDGWMDVVAVKPNGEILTFINNQVTSHGPDNNFRGNFGTPNNYTSTYFKTDFPSESILPNAQAIAAGIMDHDGHYGLALANADGHVYVYMSYNGGNSDEYYWSLVETKTVGNNPTAIALGDVDNDGILDIVTANTGDSTLSVLHGMGGGAFSDQVAYTTGIAPSCVAIGDCNGDGVKDVFVGNSGDNFFSYYLGTGLSVAPLGQEQTYGVSGPIYALNVGDFNHDSRLDIVYAAIDGYSFGIIYGDGAGNFNSGSLQNNFFQGSVPAVADLDGDGKLDVVALCATDSVAVFHNNGSSLAKTGQYYIGALPSCDAASLSVEDVDNDGKKDIVIVGFSRNLVFIKNLGGMNFADQVHTELKNEETDPNSTPQNPIYDVDAHRLALLDLDGDGFKDVIFINPGDDRVELRYNDHTGKFLSQIFLTGAGDPWNIAIGDLDGDGKADMVLTDRTNNRLTIWKGVGSSFTKIGTLAIGNKPTAVQLADLNGDGKLDVIATTLTPVNDDNDYNNDVNSDRVSVALGNGNGTFGAVSHYDVGRNALWIRVADLNYDGIPDIVASATSGSNAIWLQGRGNGTFIVRNDIIPDAPNAGLFTLADMDGDGLNDIVIGSTNISAFRVYQNVTPLMTVTGTIQIQNRTPGGVQVAFEFRRNNSDEIFTRKATLSGNGSFTLSRALAGDYTVHIKPPTGLAKNVPLSGFNGQTVNLGTISFLNGDANGDNAADISDLLILISHYNQLKNTPTNNPNYLASVDFNNDGADDIGDLLILINNYNKRGDN